MKLMNTPDVFKKLFRTSKTPKGKVRINFHKLNVKLNIRTKILGSFIIGIAFIVIISFMAIQRMDSINKNSEQMANIYTPSIKILGEMNTALVEYRRQEQRYATSSDSTEMTTIEAKIVNVEAKLNNLVKEYEEKYLVSDDIKDIFNSFKDNLQTYIADSKKIINDKKNGNIDNAGYILGSFKEDIYNSLSSMISSIIVINYDNVKEEGISSNKLYNTSRIIFLVISVICSILVLTLSLLISYNISRPVIKLEKSVKRIAEGDLTVEEIKIKNRDEIGSLAQSFNRMVEGLREVVRNVHMGAEQVSSSAEELAASAEQTSKATDEISRNVMEVTRGVEDQNKEVENVFVTFDEMNKGLSQMASNIGNSSSTAMKAAEGARSGKKIIDDAVEHMTDIAEQVNVILSTMEELKKKSENIEGIVSTISTIANQTNLLALNAAIEAARAGESGRGFAVVADEVKKLAAQSADATKEIENIINNIKRDIDSAEAATQSGTIAVDEGILVINNAGEAFKDIMLGIEEVAVQSQEIAATSEEIASGSDQVKESIGRTAEISKSASANMENVAASVEEQSATMQQLSALAESLNNMSVDLNKIIGKFLL